MDNFTFQDHVVLPASLRYVAIYNEAFELLRPIGGLLKVCRWGVCTSHHRHHATATRQAHTTAPHTLVLAKLNNRSEFLSPPAVYPGLHGT